MEMYRELRENTGGGVYDLPIDYSPLRWRETGYSMRDVFYLMTEHVLMKRRPYDQ